MAGDDIVARLRLYANASIDGGWASVFRADLNIAIDEIELLRAELVSTTNRLISERDEARRALCHVDEGWPFPDDWAREKARELGWDCFKEETDER